MKISNQELIYVLEEANKKHLNRNYLVNPYFRISKLTPETFTKYKYIENKSIDLFKVILVVILLSISLSKLFLQFLISLIFYYQHIIFRKDIKKYFDKVSQNFETLIINRGKDNGIVIMSLNEYNSFLATNHELSSIENEKRLDNAIKKLNKGDSFEKKLIEE